MKPCLVLLLFCYKRTKFFKVFAFVGELTLKTKKDDKMGIFFFFLHQSKPEWSQNFSFQ